MINTTRKCSSCKEIKSLNSFKNPSNYYCIPCKNNYDKAYTKANYVRKTIDKNLPSVKSGEYYKEYIKQRLKIDPLFKIKHNLTTKICSTFKKKKVYKNNKTLDILGCTFEQLKQHIESQFEPWMSWDNMGTKIVSSPNIMWDIDHIIPLCSAKNEDDIKQLNHYTNLRPLCSYNNRFIKRGKINLAS